MPNECVKRAITDKRQVAIPVDWTDIVPETDDEVYLQKCDGCIKVIPLEGDDE